MTDEEKPCCGDEPLETIDEGDSTEEDWQKCLQWDGKEKSLPLGVLFPAGFQASDFVKRVVVADVESDEGVKEVTLKDFDRQNMKIVDVVLNEKMIARTVEGRGGDGQFLFTEPSSGIQLTRLAWREKMGSDGWKLQAIKELLIGTAGKKPYGIGMVGR